MRSFSIGLSWRILLMTAGIGAVWYAGFSRQWGLAVLIAGCCVYLGFNLYHYVTDSNRKFTRFLESVRYSDFAVRYAPQAKKGETFGELNRQFNEVLEAFRQARAEKEANLQFLHTIVQHLATGVLAFDQAGNLLLSNTAAFQQLDVYRIRHLDDLPDNHRELRQLVTNLRSKGKALYQPDPARQLAVQGTVLMLRGQHMKLVTVQNIQPELQRKEVEAWQNLTRVLRHEIMNSVTPIASLIATMQDILHHDMPETAQNKAALSDLREALDVIAARSQSLMNFVDAYRAFSSVPAPKPTEVPVKKLFEKVSHLFQAEFKKEGIVLQTHVAPEDLIVFADPGQMEMVLINLVKNAVEAMRQNDDSHSKTLSLRAGIGPNGKACLETEDTGPGIDPALLEDIFIPFFTTKESGTGVGLSLSKQIIQNHGGNFRVRSVVGGGCCFVVEI